MKFGYNRPVVSEEKSFEIVDGWTDDGSYGYIPVGFFPYKISTQQQTKYPTIGQD